jgi:hypothetical protein
MATPPYGRRGKKKPATKKPSRGLKSPNDNAFEHASPRARFKRTVTAPANMRPRAKAGPKVTNDLPSAPRPMRQAKATNSLPTQPRAMKPATSNNGADTKPKSPRPVVGTKGPHPSVQAIAHASPNARFKRQPAAAGSPVHTPPGRAKNVVRKMAKVTGRLKKAV